MNCGRSRSRSSVAPDTELARLLSEPLFWIVAGRAVPRTPIRRTPFLLLDLDVAIFGYGRISLQGCSANHKISPAPGLVVIVRPNIGSCPALAGLFPLKMSGQREAAFPANSAGEHNARG